MPIAPVQNPLPEKAGYTIAANYSLDNETSLTLNISALVNNPYLTPDMDAADDFVQALVDALIELPAGVDWPNNITASKSRNIQQEITPTP